MLCIFWRSKEGGDINLFSKNNEICLLAAGVAYNNKLCLHKKTAHSTAKKEKMSHLNQQVEKWNRIFTTNNAEAIVMDQVEKSMDFIRNGNSNSSGSNNSQVGKGGKHPDALLLSALQQDQMTLLRKNLTKELDQTEWMYSKSMNSTGRRQPFTNLR